jgi:hypothetical protein
MALDDKNIEMSVHEGSSDKTTAEEIPRETGHSGSYGQNRELDVCASSNPAMLPLQRSH